MKRQFPDTEHSNQYTGLVRIDKWLWAARLFKTRHLAAESIKSGKVEINKVRAKPARNVSPGDSVRFRKEGFSYEVIVRQTRSRRQPAKIAVSMYEETAESVAARECLQARIKLQSQQVRFDLRKPDRRSRDVSRRVKRRDF